jgi:colanic acid biosynthesis glycosyl transferase WcaI
LQSVERLNDLLNLADLHLLPERPEAADLVMPSKLGGMLASGRPVIAAVRGDGAVAAALAGGAGVVTPPGDAVALADAIRTLTGDAARRARLGKAARAAAERDWDREAILTRFETDLISIIK